MTTVKGTTLAIVFAKDRRIDLQHDIAIAKSLSSPETGTIHPIPNSSVSVFSSVVDCVRSAIAAVNWFSQSSGGLAGIGIGMDGAGNTESALLLAEWGLNNVSGNIFLTESIFRQAQHLPGVDFREVPEAELPNQKGIKGIYNMSPKMGGFSDIVDAKLSDDTAGWDTEPQTIADRAVFGADETVIVLRSENDETNVAANQNLSGSANRQIEFTQDAILDNSDVTLANIPQPKRPVVGDLGDAQNLQEALKLIEQSEEAANQFRRRGQPYYAIYEIDLVLANTAVQEMEELEGPIEKLRAMREECLAGKGISKGLLISDSSQYLSIHRGPSFMIGRDPGDGSAGMKLLCQTLSRIPKQLRIDHHNNGYSITELGSTNGSFLDDTQLVPNQTIILQGLNKGVILSMGGVLDPPEKGGCRLKLSTLEENDAALLIQVQTSHITETLRTRLASEWPNMDRDLAKRWIYTNEPILIGSGKNCGLQLDPRKNSGPSARIEISKNGYTLVPMCDQVKLNGAPIIQPVIILRGATLSILDHDLHIEDNGG